MANRPALSVSEREVLKVLWDHGPRTVREINEVLESRGRCWAYTTVATLLQRLLVKKFAASDSTAVPHVFRALVSRDELLDRRLKDAADELCDGPRRPGTCPGAGQPVFGGRGGTAAPAARRGGRKGIINQAQTTAQRELKTARIAPAREAD